MKSIYRKSRKSEDIVHNQYLQDLDTLRKEHPEVFKKIDEVTHNYKMKVFLDSIPVYVSKTKDTKTGNYYMTGKTIFPINSPTKKQKEIRVYLGKSEDFNNDTKHPKLKEIGLRKLKEKVNEILMNDQPYYSNSTIIIS